MSRIALGIIWEISTPGQHIITVALAANDHSIFTLNGNYIQAEKTITQN